MDVIQNTLVLIGGKQGSGKSVSAAMIAPDANFSADDYGQYNEHGEYLKERAPAAHAACLHDTTKAMVAGKKVICVHNTFRTERQRIDYLIEARKHNYVVLVFEGNGGLYPSGTPTKNVHNVPQEIVDNFEWEPHQPPIPALDLNSHVLGVASWLKQTSEDLWQLVRLMAKNDWQSVPSDIRKNKDFWRLVNSFRYWDESGRYLAKKEIVKSYDLSGMRIAEFAQIFDAYWRENPDSYKLEIKQISVGFARRQTSLW